MSEIGPGSRIGRFTLDSYVGGGGFGSVWRAHDETTGEAAAVKLLTGIVSPADTVAIRADIELLAASAASRTPHVIRVLGGGVEPVPYIAMELVEGKDLAALLRDEGRLSIERTIEIGIAIADALRGLNEVGIVHRDLKPANVMIDTEGNVKLADFGIAKIVGYETVTMSGQIATTMAYAAPELWEDDPAYGGPSHKSDLYALGALLYQCLTGATPFQGAYGALYRAHLDKPPDLAALPPDSPPSLRAVIERCMAKLQTERPRDGAECLRQLQRAGVERAEAHGQPPASEPAHFGAWLRESPHATRPWSWRCRNESTGARATVELHFVDDLEEGAALRRAVTANPSLVELGGEPLLDTNRLILRPGEEWTAAPPAEFQFWLAREELRLAEPLGVVTSPLLRTAAGSLVAVIDAALREGVHLSFAPDSTYLETDGRVRLLRPGVVAVDDPEKSALAFLGTLPLDAAAADLLATVHDLRALAPTSQTFGQASTGGGPSSAKDEETEADPGLTCSYCSSIVTPGQVFCGSCGQRVGRRAEPVCPRCAAPVAGDEAFCATCGQRLSRGEQIFCPRCHASVSEDEAFCGECGQKLEQKPKELFCPSCKSKVVAGETFCGSCGHRLDAPALTAPAAPPAVRPPLPPLDPQPSKPGGIRRLFGRKSPDS